MDMEPEQADVHTTLEYRLDAEFADWLPIGVLTIFCGLFLFAIAQPGLPPPGETIGAAAAIVVGIGIAALSLWRRFRRGGPVYVLSPTGIHIRWPWVKEIFIPWCEVKEVDTIDITVWHWLTKYPRNLEYRGVTVALVSKEFYDAHIHIDSLFLRGPYWHETAFIATGELVQCALHADPVSADPRLLRKAVEARWLAFRDQPAAPLKPRTASVPTVIAAALRRAPRADATSAVPTPRIVAAGDKPRPISWWGWVKIILPLVGIVVAGSNLLGLWATDAQTTAYAKRREAAESRARYEAERKELDARLKKQRQETDDFMRRTFGR
jgi:hypothetical protein